jgi:2'-5' RNA ligase superfamily
MVGAHISRWPKPEPQSALVVLVPEAERLVGAFRRIHDPAAMAGVPAHITVLYPFQPPARVDAATVERLRSRFQRFAPFDFALTSVRRFPGVIYLAPEPDEPFRALTLAVWEAYPECPPYEGRHPDIIPHLSVASKAEEDELRRIGSDFENEARKSLPLPARASGVALMDNLFGPWRVVAVLSLGGA